MKRGDLDLICGDALDVLKWKPSGDGVGIFDACITSPPYFGLRDYSRKGQLGAVGHTIRRYVEDLVSLFGLVRERLRPEGVLWLNLGDTYNPKTGSLMGVPWRVANALRDDGGWVLRSEVIWHKPNAMPEGAQTRPARDHETVFLLAKNKRHTYHRGAICLPAKYAGTTVSIGPNSFDKRQKRAIGLDRHEKDHYTVKATRNRRTVWSINTVPCTLGHPAAMPIDLARVMMLASSMPGDRVLDPFCGSGTTGAACVPAGRSFVGIDLNDDYLRIAKVKIAAAEERAGTLQATAAQSGGQLGLFGGTK